jgi:hypothetical protein
MRTFFAELAAKAQDRNDARGLPGWIVRRQDVLRY